MKIALKLIAALGVLALGAPAYAATCGTFPLTFTCPDPLPGPTGPTGPAGPAGVKGDTGATGAPGATGAGGATGATGATGAAGTPGATGAAGLDGKDGVNGLNGRDFDMDKALAISSALATPLYLGDTERFSVSGGMGFSDNETAIGVGVMVRIDKTFSLYGGAATSTEGGQWAGRGGIRAGW